MANFITVPSSSTAICFLKTFVIEQKWTIRLAAAVISLHFIYDKITKPPASLRHLPQAGFFAVLGAIKNSKPIDQIAHEISFPTVANSNHGLYVRFDNVGWTVHVIDPGAVRAILMSNDLFPKSITSLQTRRGTLAGRLVTGPNILFLSGDHWKKQRKVINPSFHRALPLKIFGRLSQKMLDTIETEKDDGKLIDICDITQRWALDVLGEFAFGFKFHALENNGDDNEWVRRYNTIVKAATNPLYFVFPSIERQFKSWIPGRRKAHEELEKFFGMIHAMADERRQVILNSANTVVADEQKKHAGEKDLLTLMIEAEHEGQGRLTDEEFESNLSIFFLAGHDTTASAVAFAIYHLAVHPDKQRKAREEVIRIFGDDHSGILPTLEQTHELSYINMVIKENLRVNPPAVNMIPRRATQDTELAGVFIPKDTCLSIDVYDLHHNPKVWKNPDQFDPERFAPGGEVDQLSGSGLPWTPFSNGLRSCIGMNFSLMSQRVLLSMLLRKYEWSLPENSIHKEKILTEGLQIIKPKDLFVKFTKRY
ncbi:cytochrome P450 [Circinella umbellata]|nr:cytochrome P450 [Circinella umbellata]